MKQPRRPTNAVFRALADDDVMAVLRGHQWPGNVRELENVIERALVLGDGARVTLDDLPDSVKDRPSQPGQAGGRRLADVEGEHIARTLRELAGNKAAAATRAQEITRNHRRSRDQEILKTAPGIWESLSLLLIFWSPV